MIVGTLVRAPFQRRAWAEVLYAAVSLVLAAAGIGYVVAALLLGVGLAVTALGVPIIALAVHGARRFGGLHRRLALTLLGTGIEGPAPLLPGTGFLGRVQAGLSDVAGWRALTYLMVQAPAALVQGYVVLFTWGWGVVGATYPLQRALGLNPFAPFDASWRQALVCVAGLALLLLAPWAVHAAILPNLILARWLLGPYRPDERIRSLERSRALMAGDAVTTLRRIERDLHDGAQVRLVGLTMQLTMLREAAPDGPLRELAGAAQSSAREAIAELRELVRGIHPPMLDQGLEAALESLAARSGLRVEVGSTLTGRPAEAIETIAYFCAAELLANAAKHSGVTEAALTLAEIPEGRIVLEVRDEGAGTARLVPGGGLDGLRERVRAVDGDLRVDSTPRGPTVVRVELPARL